MARVLVIGDTHLPAVHPGYLAFCRDLESQYRCNKVIHIGDVIDFHGISMHDTNPDAPGPKQEYDEVLRLIPQWYKAFPTAHVCLGNHDARVARMAATVNIPELFLKSYNAMFGTPKWIWSQNFVIDDVYYFHGTGTGGMYPAFTTMQKMLMSVVCGHIHTAAGIWWRANPQRRVFGMNTGCGINDQHLAFKYGENLKIRSILSAAVILDGIPTHVVMPCGPREKYHKSRFTRSR